MQDRPTEGTAESDPSPVIDRIREMVTCSRLWTLEAAEIRDLLGVRNEEFYRRIYAAESRGHPLISLDSGTAGYSQENIWEFLALVELFCGSDTEARLEQAGIFFSHPEQMEILGLFLSETAAVLRLHQVDSEQFAAMLRTFGRFERARDVYIQEYFPLDELIERAAESYCSARTFTIPGLARANARGLIEFFFRKHVLQAGNIFAVLIDRLLRLAAAQGYAREDEPSTDQQERIGSGAPDPSSQLGAARRVMSLENRALSLPLLKSQYKRLMKIYHPDINPNGLRRCQEITAAYSLLLSSL